MIRNGIILKVHKNSISIIDSEGQYLSLRKKEKVEVGKSIIFIEDDIISNNQSKAWTYIATAAAVLLLAVGVVFNFYGRTPVQYSVVSIDINPSLEIYVDKDEIVHDIVTYNPEAEVLVDFEWENRNIEYTLEEIISKGSEYYDGEHIIEIGVVDRFDGNLEEEIIAITESSEDLKDVEVYVYKFSEDYEKKDSSKSLMKNYEEDTEETVVELINEESVNLKKEKLKEKEEREAELEKEREAREQEREEKKLEKEKEKEEREAELEKEKEAREQEREEKKLEKEKEKEEREAELEKEKEAREKEKDEKELEKEQEKEEKELEKEKEKEKNEKELEKEKEKEEKEVELEKEKELREKEKEESELEKEKEKEEKEAELEKEKDAREKEKEENQLEEEKGKKEIETEADKEKKEKELKKEEENDEVEEAKNTNRGKGASRSNEKKKSKKK